MADKFLPNWMDLTRPDAAVGELVLLRERANTRATSQSAIEECVKDHLAGLEILAKIKKYENSLAYIRNKLPTSKRVRSGDFGEILASEYVDQFTEYRVPIKKLRWKDDRVVAMRGNDVVAIRQVKGKPLLLKVESKSRAALSDGAVKEAVSGLDKHAGRPNPSSLAFISSRLREQGRDDEARVFEDLQGKPPAHESIEHMVFTLSGNQPLNHLKNHAGEKGASFRRHLVGCVITDHQNFINTLFDKIHAGNRSRDSHAS